MTENEIKKKKSSTKSSYVPPRVIEYGDLREPTEKPHTSADPAISGVIDFYHDAAVSEKRREPVL